ncbi:hypothetical protein ACRQ5B_10715 [Pseudarthrobacter sp. L19]|uniref:hypothetical protein n=1 Tax=Pseudarthrobacter sp. L19 TaxID=3423951 RepID=UPI003D7A9CF0
MGIRYYAYAFDSDQAAKALADPRTVIGLVGGSSALSLESEVAYANAFLDRAKVFVSASASDGRGFAYIIG